MVKFHDPRGEVATAIESYELGLNIEPDSTVTVGLLANGFPDSENFLNAVGAALRKRFPNITLKSWNKGNASVPASAEMLAEIEASCQVAIAAYGH